MCTPLQVPYFPPAQSIADFTPDICKMLLLAAIGQPGIEMDVLSIRTWTMHAEVAERLQVGLSRAALSGPGCLLGKWLEEQISPGSAPHAEQLLQCHGWHSA